MKKHYDVAIAGFWYGYNYGSLLNGYATYRIFKSFGKDVLMIQKPNSDESDPEISSGHNTMFVRRNYEADSISESLPYSRLSELNDICDCFCAGSDQIWNFFISFEENMYLPFVKDDKKIISFATSFGHKNDDVPQEAKLRISQYLKRFSAISVREQFDLDILKADYGLKGELVLEPVFCVEKEIFDELAEKSDFNEDKPYIFSYILDPTPQKREAILFYEKITGLKVVNILDGVPHSFLQNKDILDMPNILENASAEDFLCAVKNSAFVITDSFHGTAFSIIFQKPFLSIGNYGRGFERFTDLLGRLNLMDRLVFDPENIPHDESFLLPVDYTETNKIIAEEAKKTVDWIRYAVNIPKDVLDNITPFKNITTELDKNLCMGCGACVSTCPTDALCLKPDELGFYRSICDEKKCVECGKCIEVCPALKLPGNGNTSQPSLHEFVAADEKVLFSSSSGGFFTVLATEVFKKGGVVFGAAWKDDLTVEHIMISSPEELYKLQKSKYLQSYTGDIFRQVKKELERNVLVLFTGCPCQVAGLKKFLNKEYDNLIAVDLLCGNAPSTMFFQKYLDDDFDERPKSYEFRSKDMGWNWDRITAVMPNETRISRNGGKDDSYQRAYHPHIMCPPHCEKCRYQILPRFGDITMGDFWWIDGKDKDLDTHKGVSAVLCNNNKGQMFFDNIPEEAFAVKKQVPLNWLGGNGNALVTNDVRNWISPYRNAFFDAIKTMPFKEAFRYAVKPNRGEYPPPLFIASQRGNVFQFDPNIWSEDNIQGYILLTTKIEYPAAGLYASVPLKRPLEKHKKYAFKIRFKASTEANLLNFHIKSAGETYFQVIYSHHTTPDDDKHWVEINSDFIADSDFYDEFMIGASQICGKKRWLVIDVLSITEKNITD